MIIVKDLCLNYSNAFLATPKGWIFDCLTNALSNERKRQIFVLNSDGKVKYLVEGLVANDYPIAIYEQIDYEKIKCCTINQKGDLLKFDGPCDYSNSFNLDKDKHNKFLYKITTRSIDKTLAILLGLRENEVGIIIANSETNESKVFSVPIEGNFHKGYLNKIDLRFSADLLTFVVFQNDCETNAFIFDNPLV